MVETNMDQRNPPYLPRRLRLGGEGRSEEGQSQEKPDRAHGPIIGEARARGKRARSGRARHRAWRGLAKERPMSEPITTGEIQHGRDELRPPPGVSVAIRSTMRFARRDAARATTHGLEYTWTSGSRARSRWSPPLRKVSAAARRSRSPPRDVRSPSAPARRRASS